MSVRLMAEVFERYPNGGGEMLLALALADHASDDGTSVYPKVKALAEKTRQSERTVQYQLRAMQEAGWLILVGSGNGGRSMSTEYRISPIWIKGANIAPIQKGATDDVKGATDDTKGCNPQQKRVQRVAPANNHHRTINEPSEPSGESALKRAAPAKPDDVSQQAFDGWMEVRRSRRAGKPTELVWAATRREAEKAGISVDDAVTTCVEASWVGFRADWYENRMAKSPRPSKAPGKHTGFSTMNYSEGISDDGAFF